MLVLYHFFFSRVKRNEETAPKQAKDYLVTRNSSRLRENRETLQPEEKGDWLTAPIND